MDLTDIEGIDEDVAARLAEAGLGTVDELQRAEDAAIEEVAGPDVLAAVRGAVGAIHLDEEGRTDYQRTLGIADDHDVDAVEVEPPGAGDNPLEAAGEKFELVLHVERTAVEGAAGGNGSGGGTNGDGNGAGDGDGDGPADVPPFQEYRIQARPSETVLNVLHRIKDTVDPTLTFSRSCGQAICGICAVRINGVPRLVCNTPVKEVAEGRDRVTITPLHNLPTIRDLVSDKGPFWDEVKKLKPWLIRDPDEPLDPDRESIMYPEDLPDVMQMANCINCAVCFSDCDARRNDEQFLGPMAAAKVYRFVADPRDAATDERLRMADDNNVWSCMFAYQCAWCPKGVEPQEAINILRKRIMARQGYDNRASHHVRAFVESAKKYGRLDERTLPMKTKGLFAFLKEDAPKALIWGMTFKVPPPIHHGVKHKREVRRLMEAIPHPDKYGQRLDILEEEGEL